ncbi:hypothetical protein Leryth_008876 [Lithospermum erythrorhizon]|nr:hypothetical protein Leryth_008876 [Lithospermum erythrorhizon]
MHTKKRKEDTNDHLKTVLGDTMISCEIEMVGSDITVFMGPYFLPEAMAEDMSRKCSTASDSSDYNIQISYGRCTTKRKPECELDLFIMQADELSGGGRPLVFYDITLALKCQYWYIFVIWPSFQQDLAK